MSTQKKSNTNFVAEQPRRGWAYFEKSDIWRRTPYPWGAPGNHFPKEYGDWVAVAKPKAWSPPEGSIAGESLLGGGSASLRAAADGDGGSGGGTGYKLGKGGHGQQQYDPHSDEYEGDGGGSSTGPVDRAKVRNWSKPTPPGQEAKPAPKLQEQRPPAPLSKGGRVVATTKNDNPKKDDPNPEALSPKTREQVQSVLDKSPVVHDFNMNSGYRSDDSTAHGEGRSVDVNRVNGQKVSDAVNPEVPAEQREAMRERLEEVKASAKANEEVEAYIDPLDGFFRPVDPMSKSEGRKAGSKDIYNHRDHIHITIRK
ncbi:MAG: hypothetical protein Q7U56_12060 [Humidesulfovibrio sp.]|nr:hypothetical protein [Desulfovibrio sp.]MDO9084003.1 hypothetical protein [Humidesulfovibrio sp.]